MEPFLPCHPIAYNWDKSIPGGHCENQNQTNFAVGVTNLVIDLLVVALPMPMLWKLQLTLSRKLQVMGMFGLGAMLVFTSFPFVSIAQARPLMHVLLIQNLYHLPPTRPLVQKLGRHRHLLHLRRRRLLEHPRTLPRHRQRLPTHYATRPAQDLQG